MLATYPAEAIKHIKEGTRPGRLAGGQVDQKEVCRTFESHHEIVESILILLISLWVILIHIFVDSFLDDLNCSLDIERTIGGPKHPWR